MSTSRELFMAILAMDSYNRGYDPGMEIGTLSGSNALRIGTGNVLEDSSILLDADGNTWRNGGLGPTAGPFGGGVLARACVCVYPLDPASVVR